MCIYASKGIAIVPSYLAIKRQVYLCYGALEFYLNSRKEGFKVSKDVIIY